MKQEETGLNTPSLTFKQKRKQDALDLAELIYDMFVEAEAATNKEGDESV